MWYWTQARELGFQPGKQTDLSSRIKMMYSEHFIDAHSGEEEEREEEAKEVSHATSSPAAASAAPGKAEIEVGCVCSHNS